ncbi:hypothetical protein BV22DRAFT_1114015 [Leucogyrophana mollusca]|uniref:Uncharacterized protein n=1 Tax=Leucogyrophana mollusca TaxID=85980 RepID=A0ACB8BA41_9AGAM|nr:hypothetical protein BV22DRAFT_1114015 [Leucogyrophana mollusca]
MSALPKSVSGFTVIPVAYARSTHILYARAHASPKSKSNSGANLNTGVNTGANTGASAKSKPLPDGRTLFLVNVPPDATEREIVLFFKHCGTVERVVFDLDDVDVGSDVDGNASGKSDGEEGGEDGEDGMDETADVDADADADQHQPNQQPPKKRRKPTQATTQPTPPKLVPLPSAPLRTLRKTGLSAHLVFLDAASLSRALAPAPKPRPWPASEEPRGLAHYAALHDARRPPLDAVKAHADSAVALFEFEVEAARRQGQGAHRRGEAVVDADGFTLVARGGAYGKALGGGVGIASRRFELTGKTTAGRGRKKEAKEKEAFYAFQKAEKQRKAIMDLKKGFEADKARIEKMREARRFKPY